MNEREHVELELASPASFDVVACRIEEAMSCPTRAAVTVHGDDALDFEAAVGKEATLAVAVGTAARRFALTLARVRYAGRRHGRQRFVLELESAPWPLGLRRDTRKFRKRTAEQIVGAVLEAHAVGARFALVRPTPRRNYCVQYDETDRAFVERLLAFEGIFYVAEGDGSLSLGDVSAALPLCVEEPVRIVAAEGALRHAEPAIHALRAKARVTSGKVTVGDYDWKRPALDLRASATAERFAELEIYDWLTGYRNPADGATLARVRLEAERALASTLEGSASVLAFGAGRAFRFADPPHEAGGAEQLLVAVVHELFFGGEASYHNTFVAIPRERPFRPALGARPNIRGHHTARVRGPAGSEIHCDRHGRFRAQFHWDRAAERSDADSRWLRLVQHAATSLFLARVGWEMFVTYVDGDPDRPLGVGRALNGVMPPVYGQPGHKTAMSIKTPSSPGGGGFNEWRMNDAAGVMAIDVHAERDFIARTGNDQRETVGRDEVRVVQGMLSRAVEGAQSVRVGANDELAVGGSCQLSVAGDFSRSVCGAEHVKTGDGLTERADGDDSELVAAVRLSIAGSIHVPSPKDTLAGMVKLPSASSIALAALSGLPTGAGPSAGALAAAAAPSPSAMASSLVPSAQNLIGSIARTSAGPALRAVGGAEIAVCGGALSHAAEKGLTGVVGGARLVVATGGDIAHKATDLTLRAGAAIVRKAGTDASYASAVTTVVVGADATLVAGETVALRAGSVTLEGRERLSLTVGAAQIELTPAGVALRGKLALTPNDSLKVVGSVRDELGST